MSIIEKARSKINNPAKRTKESKLLLCICATTKKKFCVRLDRRIGEFAWHMAYAFPYHTTMQNESYVDSQKEHIHISEDLSEWNGCPFCGGKIMEFCQCGSIFCSNKMGVLTCPSCGVTDTYSASSDFNVKTASH